MPSIGPYSVHAIETGHLCLDGGAMFGIVPRTLWERCLAPDTRGRIRLSMRCLLLEGAGRLILVDTGVGDKYDARFKDWFAIDHTDTDLNRAILAAGFMPGEITDVILTHLHFDHAGGSTVRRLGKPAPRFANAVYHVQRSHLESARSPNAREAASFLPENFEPLAAAGQLHCLDGSGPLFPGIEIWVVHGHTEAQQLVKVSGPEGTLVFVADLLPTTHHVRLPWIMAYDVRPLVTLAEKERFLCEAERQRVHLFFEHDPEVAIANVSRGKRGMAVVNRRPLEELH